MECALQVGKNLSVFLLGISADCLMAIQAVPGYKSKVYLMPGAASVINSLPFCKAKLVARGLALPWEGDHRSVNTPNIFRVSTVSLLGCSVFENNSAPMKTDK